MRVINIASVLIIVAAILAMLPHLILVKIRPGETGVLNRQFGGGLAKQDFGPGYWLDLGPLHTWDVIDTTVQTLDMVRNPKRTPAAGDVHGPLDVKSAGGSTVQVDVTIKYRIKPGHAWEVLKGFGKTAYRRKVHSEAIEIMRPAFGNLDNEDFYDPIKRKDLTAKMEVDLQKRLDRIPVELIAILIRDIGYDAAYEEQIKQKTLAEQDKELQSALAAAEEQKGKTERIKAETSAKVAEIEADKMKTLTEMRAENDKKIRRIQADAEKYVVEMRSKADLYASIKEADGIKLLRDATAKGETLRRQALAIEGGATLVALEAVKNLQFGEMTLSTQAVNPLDLEGLLRLLGAK